jgi:hypothetical protein
MRKEDCIELLKKRIPESSHPQVNFVLQNGVVLAVDTVARFEQEYIVFRGREGGSTDEGRAFFVPYNEISYVKIERIVRLGELKEMYGEKGYVDAEERLSGGGDASKVPPGTQPPPSTPAPVGTGDPAAIAKQNLLNRIRAARANLGGTTGKLGSDNK